MHLQVFGLGLTSEIEPHLFGGWSQSSLLSPSTQIHKISEDSNIKSFVFSDPAATAIRVFKQASHHVGEWLVIGSGALGCAIAASLKALGVECLWMAGNPDQRESAGPFCGEQFIEMTRTSSLTASKMLSLGLRPVCIVDTIGSTESIDACIEAAEPGASIFLVGGLVVRKIPFNSGALTKSEISIRGVLAYTNDEFAKAVKLIQSHPDVFGRIRTRELPLSVARESVFLRSDRKVIINCQT